jgi:CAAX prenyl protease-like protein
VFRRTELTRGFSGALLAGTPYRLLAGLVAAVASCAALARAGLLPSSALAVAGVAAGHGGMLAVAIGWSARGRAPDAAVSPLTAVALVALTASAAAVHEVGALLYLVLPLWLARHAACGRLVALGLGTPIPRGALALGVLAGVFLGAHLLVAASLTLGHMPRLDAPVALVTTFAYDAGVQVLATESFLRGALFNRLQRRGSFASAAAVSTVVCVVRYLGDPLLPGAVELVTGAVFYVTLLSLVGSWLFWSSGSLVPGYAAALVFFTAYRLLGVW